MQKGIDELNIREKIMFVRVDFNVPLKNGVITDDARIKAALPTIEYAVDNRARTILASHLGRPKGAEDPALSLKPVAEHLNTLIKAPVHFVDDCTGESVNRAVNSLKPGEVLLLENLRFHPGEKKNDEQFAKALARHVEVYVNDAFGSSHRAHASIVGVPSLVDQKGIGFLMKKEVKFLSPLLESPEKPFAAVLGGAKVSDKIGVIKNLLKRVDAILIGGGMAFTFLKAKGYEVGTSLCEEEKLDTAKEIMEEAEKKNVKLLFPEDVIVAGQAEENVDAETVSVSEIPSDKMGLDIGPKTIKMFEEEIKNVKTVFWNGPMGVFELERFQNGTFAVARAVADYVKVSVIGGGDSASAAKVAGIADKISHISTGGGASLEFMEGISLPGIQAVDV